MVTQRGRTAGVRAVLKLPIVLSALCAATAAPARADAALPDTFLARLEALASMETLDAELLASRSATLTLEAWCASHALAAVPRLVAVRVRDAGVPASAEQRRRLEVGQDEPIAHRRVRLTCGDRVLSEADNWFVPSRLTPAMNEALASTDVPFGKVVAPLAPQRQTFAAAVLWQVLPPGWERHAPLPDGTGALNVPPVLFEHRAVLYDAQRRPFSEVNERYTSAVLAFGRTPPSPSPAGAR